MSTIHPLQHEFDQLEHYFEMGNLHDYSVSKSGTFWHIDHCLRILEAIPQNMATSTRENYAPKSSLLKWLIMTFQWMPRGKARSPEHVRPEAELLTEKDIRQRFQHAYKLTSTIQDMPEYAHFKHPMFGSINKRSTVKFLKIHTHHHLKILRDIVKNQ
jgi:hypothetical protein